MMHAHARTFWGWTIALVGSILLNISLFGLMPGLIQGLPDKPKTLDDLKPIQVIRAKKTPPPPQRTAPKKTVPPPKPLKKVPPSRNTIIKPTSVNLKPRLAFALNPNLPTAPLDLVIPDLAHFSMEAPVLKSQYTMDELDSQLTPLVKLPPIYPIRATRRGIEGFVTVEFLVTDQGLVQAVTIIEAEPKNIFDKNVIQCVAHWKFRPGTVDGIPVATLARTTIRFKLER
ncbi:energy transducer TonB [Desulfobacula sp.]|uniref:energy transducer TonB n=1 Tax=Desulfobacula sp. TaxID=2593537 RepID=UPI002623BFAC|nr:energy transducer TonB [Desulfobacula sp.]